MDHTYHPKSGQTNSNTVDYAKSYYRGEWAGVKKDLNRAHLKFLPCGLYHPKRTGIVLVW